MTRNKTLLEIEQQEMKSKNNEMTEPQIDLFQRASQIMQEMHQEYF